MTPEQTIKMYAEMVALLDLDRIRYIERMALEQEPMEDWPDEARFQLIRMFEQAILMAENAELPQGHPKRSITVH